MYLVSGPHNQLHVLYMYMYHVFHWLAKKKIFKPTYMYMYDQKPESFFCLPKPPKDRPFSDGGLYYSTLYCMYASGSDYSMWMNSKLYTALLVTIHHS